MTEAEIGDLVVRSNPYVFRNNRGRAVAVDRNGKKRVIRFGIPEPRGKNEKPEDFKGGDYIGWTAMTITPEMVGQTIAVFTSIEIKTETDTVKPGQERWLELVRSQGGRAEIWQEKNNEIFVK